MRRSYLLLAVGLCACSDPVQPVFPSQGDYVFVGGTTHGYPLPSWASWDPLPFEYDVEHVPPCTFRATAGSLSVVADQYTLDLQQEVVSCPYSGLVPAAHESGRLQRVRDANTGEIVDWFIMDAEGGWAQSGRHDGESIYVDLAPPEGGLVHLLRFDRVR